MPFPYSMSLDGTAGTQLGTGNTGADNISGGSASNATFFAGALGVPGATNHAKFTATRRLRNDLPNPTVIYALRVIMAPVKPTTLTQVYTITAGGINNQRGGWSINDKGEVQFVVGLNGAGNPGTTKANFADGRTWAVLHEWDKLGVLNETAPGTARQRIWVFREGGALEEHIEASITNTAGTIDASYTGIITDSITWELHMARARADSTRAANLYWKSALDRLRVGGVTHNRCELAVQASGSTSVRVTTTGGELAVPLVSSPVTPGDTGHCKIVVSGLPTPAVAYSHAIEVYEAMTATWLPTLTQLVYAGPKPGAPQADVVVDWTCHKQEGTGVLFPNLVGRLAAYGGNPGMWVNKGDYHYDNPGTNPQDPLSPWMWIGCWNRQDDLVAGIKNAYRWNMYTSPDDHDIGVENAVFNHPNINRAFAALKASHPLPEAPSGMPATGTFYSSIQRGEVMHVFPQFTNMYRSDPAAANVTWNIGDPPPTKSPFGAAQDAWLQALYTSPQYNASDGGFVAYVLYLNKGWDLISGGLGGKTDHHHLYPEHRKWLGWLIGQRRGMIVTGDNHYVGVKHVDRWSGLPLVHNAAAHRDSGNTNSWDPNMDATYPSPPSITNVDMQMAALIESSRSGSSFTLTGTIYDAAADMDRLVTSRTWQDVPFVGDHGWYINGRSLAELGVTVQVGSNPFRVPAKRGANKVLAGVNGTIFRGDKRHDENRFTHRYSAITGNLGEVRAIMRTLSRWLNSGNDKGLLELKYIDELGEVRAFVEAAGAQDHEVISDSADEVAVEYTVPSGFFEDLLPTVQELVYDPVDGTQTLYFPATAGASGPVQTAIIRLKGLFGEPRITDPQGGGAVKYLGIVNTANVLTINSATGEVDEDGDDRLDQFEQYGVGKLITLKPDPDTGMYGLTIETTSNGANPGVELELVRTHLLA